MNTPHTFYGNFLLFLLLFGPLAHSILLGLSADYALYTIHAFFFLSLSHFFPDVERSFVFDDNNNSIYYMNNFMAVSVFENSIELYRIHGECRKFFFSVVVVCLCICVGIVIGIHYIRFHLLIICFLLRFSLNKLMQTFITEWALLCTCTIVFQLIKWK